MKKTWKKRLIAWLFVLPILGWMFRQPVYAKENEIHSIDMEVTVQSDGSAHIHSIWDMSQYEGTEIYVPMGKTGKAQVKDFKVSENGEVFDDLGEDWEVDASLAEKANKSGINVEDDQQELSWGIGSYGHHTYILDYTITDFVRETSDHAYVAFWKYLNDSMNIPVKQMTLTFKGEKPFKKEDLRVWGFGFDGDTKIHDDGTITAESIGKIKHFTLLVTLPEQQMTTKATVDKTQQEIIDQAKAGSSYAAMDEEEYQESWLDKIIFGATFVAIFLGVLALVKAGTLGNSSHYKSSVNPKHLKDQYFREVPLKGPLYQATLPVTGLKLGDTQTIMSAYFLKWIKEGKLSLVDEKSSGLLFKEKDKKALRIHPEKFDTSEGAMPALEKQLYQMILAASGSNEILESKEFSRWAKKHYKKMNEWQEDLLAHSENDLLEADYYTYEMNKSWFKQNRLMATTKGTQLEENIIKFRNYLLDFSLLNEREAKNVYIWDDLLIWASLLGIADKVSEEFRKLYPEYAEETVLTSDVIYWVHMYPTRAVSAATSAAASATSSGLGGGTSIGGGGGSFGGGSGGGFR